MPRVTHGINPVTGRKVVIGGRTWKKLVNDGYLDIGQQAPYNYRSNDPMENRKRQRPKRPRLTNEQTARKTADAAVNLIDDIQNHKMDIPLDMSQEEAREYLQGLIFNKMLAQKKEFLNNRLEPKGKPRGSGRPKSSFKIRKRNKKPKRQPVRQQEEIYYEDDEEPYEPEMMGPPNTEEYEEVEPIDQYDETEQYNETDQYDWEQ